YFWLSKYDSIALSSISSAISNLSNFSMKLPKVYNACSRGATSGASLACTGYKSFNYSELRRKPLPSGPLSILTQEGFPSLIYDPLQFFQVVFAKLLDRLLLQIVIIWNRQFTEVLLNLSHTLGKFNVILFICPIRQFDFPPTATSLISNEKSNGSWGRCSQLCHVRR